MIAGRYELEREVGRGGMGAVWLARDTTLGREVAVKRLGSMPGDAAAEEVAQRAEREARLAARLNHPHVVHVFDLIEDGEGRWLVMEYVEGQTLSALIRAEGALAPGRASRLLGQAADALAAAHAAGIVHRDVKPSNILVAGDQEVKLSDFGIARAEADPSLTQTGLVTGSPAYLSPEVASGHMATTASDVWSLGATLYHALSGQPPYEVGDNLMGALFRIVHEQPPRLPDPGWLGPLLEATMTTDPEDRWTMAQVRDFLDSQGQVATPAPESTQVMAPIPAVLPATATVTPPDAGTPAAEEEPTPARQGRRRPRLVPVLLGLAVLVAAGVLGWTLLSGDEGGSPTIQRPEQSDGTKASGGGQQPDEASSSPAEPTRAGMRGFITDYLATAPNAPESSFEMLTRGFQRDSGGLGSYSGYWSTISEAEPVEITADPESLVVQYVVAYTREDGSEVTDSVQLQLAFEDGRYLIADEA